MNGEDLQWLLLPSLKTEEIKGAKGQFPIGTRVKLPHSMQELVIVSDPYIVDVPGAPWPACYSAFKLSDGSEVKRSEIENIPESNGRLKAPVKGDVND